MDRATTPACVVACPVEAKIFGDILNEESPISKYLKEHEAFQCTRSGGRNPKFTTSAPRMEVEMIRAFAKSSDT